MATVKFKRQEVTTGHSPNPALLIGLELTPVSAICFCLKSRSLQEGDGKNKSHVKKVETLQSWTGGIKKESAFD